LCLTVAFLLLILGKKRWQAIWDSIKISMLNKNSLEIHHRYFNNSLYSNLYNAVYLHSGDVRPTYVGYLVNLYWK